MLGCFYRDIGLRREAAEQAPLYTGCMHDRTAEPSLLGCFYREIKARSGAAEQAPLYTGCIHDRTVEPSLLGCFYRDIEPRRVQRSELRSTQGAYTTGP
ncbi:hypothetical protein ABB29_03680 [Pseudoxanthomonas dokdonensis]|uniref:Uncharacterized protein n=1 Tax=Pseudoxanthomonas dokdonensis TaxID=344882 RepID=A0A0R0CXX5_9GAMM|nr:hypothetical protein ABB29_03680 [Pseudoxanthomonas dokdonensis]